ncbi:hypothetical protein [Thalassovita aquimarina]|uniref:Uncharacterized protein n=1 Tax=Thalassovita aquimarina TaxID=2785917 RepID=A0ABS5HN74_9RHOB|nr:hypothetical protein [Thalassovita aquimarina]MBR9650363.1 hypothetical protein [Thalassovita aquimarina]
MLSSRKSKLGIAALFGVSTLVLSGCADYLSNRDTVTARVGNASMANTAIQEIQPWPPAAYKTTVGYGG